MRYQLDTIPVWDAYKAGGECPLCALRQQNEAMYVDSFLGASVMEPDTRVEVNEKGFCPEHFRQMFAQKNRLGLALITHTYMKDVIASVDAILERAAQGDGGGLLRRLGGKPSAKENPGAAVRARTGKCVLCERLDYTMRRYAYTLVHLFTHDREFQRVFLDSQGLCLQDTALVLDMACEMLSGRERTAFFRAVRDVQQKNLERVEKELEWFTLKFDYRNQDKPWGNSRDALERAINKLQGACVHGGEA